MTRPCFVKSFAIALAGWSLLAGSAAQAAPAPAASNSSLVTVSAFGTAQSRAIICAANCAAVAAAAAQYSDDDTGGGGTELLILLAVVAAMVAAFLLLDDEVLGDGDGLVIEPISPA